ncbi:MAG: hypothetical protein ACOYBR_07865 [Fluviibacter sp.]
MNSFVAQFNQQAIEILFGLGVMALSPVYCRALRIVSFAWSTASFMSMARSLTDYLDNYKQA